MCFMLFINMWPNPRIWVPVCTKQSEMYYAWLCDIIIFLLETQSFYCYSSSQTSFCSWEQIKISPLFVGSFHPPSPLLQSPSSLPINSSKPFSPQFTGYCSTVFVSLSSWRSLSFVPLLTLFPSSLHPFSDLPSVNLILTSFLRSLKSGFLQCSIKPCLRKHSLKINGIVPVNMHLASWNNRNTPFKNCLK